MKSRVLLVETLLPKLVGCQHSKTRLPHLAALFHSSQLLSKKMSAPAKLTQEERETVLAGVLAKGWQMDASGRDAIVKKFLFKGKQDTLLRNQPFQIFLGVLFEQHWNETE